MRDKELLPLYIVNWIVFVFVACFVFSSTFSCLCLSLLDQIQLCRFLPLDLLVGIKVAKKFAVNPSCLEHWWFCILILSKPLIIPHPLYPNLWLLTRLYTIYSILLSFLFQLFISFRSILLVPCPNKSYSDVHTFAIFACSFLLLFISLLL